MSKKLNKNRKKKSEKRDASILNGSFSRQKISSNWFSFIKNDSKKLAQIKNRDVTKNLNFKNSKFCRQPVVTKVLSLDCEMVSNIDDKDMLARVSIVNYQLQCLYDKYVKPISPIGDYRTRFSGIRESDLVSGTDFSVIQKEVKNLLRNKILVGHALGNDFKVLKFGHHKALIRDTSKYQPFQEISDGKTPSLKILAKSFLGENIQEGEHNSVEDATTAMKLYIKYRHEWENSLLSRKEKNRVPKAEDKVEKLSLMQ